MDNKKTFGSVCDGIGCGRLAFTQAGYECVWHAEIEPYPSAVTEYHWPGGRNVRDMRLVRGMIEAGELPAVDVFTGGTPCQAFSVAGKRKGLDDERGNLSLEFCKIADAIDAVRRRDGKPPCAVLWENVPGVLSDKGNAFGCFLGELAGSGCELQPPGEQWNVAGCVYGPARTVAWRTLDSQFFGVAQRRRRVFVVASAGDGCRPEEVLFEREGVRRDTPPSRESRQGVAGDAGIGVAASLRAQAQCSHRADSETYVPVMAFSCKDNGRDSGVDIAPCLRSMGGKRSDGSNGDSGGGQVAIAIQDVRGVDKAQNGRRYNADGTAYTVDAMATQGVAVAFEPHHDEHDGRGINFKPSDTHPTIRGPHGCDNTIIAHPSSVRRLTPVECERLQGLPDNWTRIPWRGKPESECPDSPRYKGIGNGQTVNVMRWLASMIMLEQRDFNV